MREIWNQYDPLVSSATMTIDHALATIIYSDWKLTERYLFNTSLIYHNSSLIQWKWK